MLGWCISANVRRSSSKRAMTSGIHASLDEFDGDLTMEGHLLG
jgi:hypothetical protein